MSRPYYDPNPVSGPEQYANADFKNIMRFDVQPDGALTNGTVFVPGEGSDGIKVDTLGNVYTTAGAGPGEVRITSPQGVREEFENAVMQALVDPAPIDRTN